jgi:hypothetical protein
MEFLASIACGVIAITLLGAVILVPLRLRHVRELQALADSELERRAFRYEKTYFLSIGVDHPDTVAFKHFIETKNLSELRANWGRLSRVFRRLERKAGHRGRPLIMEYYNSYELVLAELSRRRRLKHVAQSNDVA